MCNRSSLQEVAIYASFKGLIETVPGVNVALLKTKYGNQLNTKQTRLLILKELQRMVELALNN